MFAIYSDQIIFLQVFAAGIESEFEILVHHFAVLAEVVLFHAVYFWIEDVDRVAGAQHRARIRLGDLDAHFVVFANPELSDFR